MAYSRIALVGALLVLAGCATPRTEPIVMPEPLRLVEPPDYPTNLYLVTATGQMVLVNKYDTNTECKAAASALYADERAPNPPPLAPQQQSGAERRVGAICLPQQRDKAVQTP